MANAIYPNFKEALLNGEINLATDNIVAYAVDTVGSPTDYTYSATHTTLTDLPAAARVAVTPNLTSKTITDGVFDSADPVLPSVTGDQFEAVVLYDSTSDNLIAYYDGLSQTPSGNNITINVNASGWFAL
tara:strand:+ start:344 stop:733 length:390 start_codon:yes stop_codon:yes gene_type:complete